MLIKSKRNEEDSYIGLLHIRNTPQEKNLLSPIEQLIGRKTRSMLPHHNKDIYAEVHNDLKTGADLNQRTDLKPLDVGQIVRIQPLQRGETIWKEGKVIERIFSRYYLIKKNDGKEHAYSKCNE